MALSPWPTTPAALANATAALKAAIGPDLDDATVQRLGAVASALVENYAPSAPQILRDEAVIRVAGRLHETPGASIRSESTGDISTSFSPSMTGAMLHSGAKSLLYGFRTKLVGVSK